ncbi:hypothetical protein ACFQ36_21175 [Arthrobacter sp. GCM10027362]|uniref:hypothetical protein n=1 Tax=Arthrobacter sp. GCM10027362 TaxID=3273379 RepID=UPI00364561A8
MPEKPAPDDGAVLPILHLNSYKTAAPRMPARVPGQQRVQLRPGLWLSAALRDGAGST